MNSLIEARDRFSKANPERRVTVNGREWGVVRAGEAGPGLLLIPGTLGRGDIFWQQIDALSGRARIAALTYPATGGVGDWSGDLAALLTGFGFERASVLGSSLGGYLVQHFAGTHPQRVDRLLAANTLASVSQISGRPPYGSDLDRGPIDELRAGFGNGLKAWAESHPDQAELVELLLAEVGGRIPEPELRTRLNALKRGPKLPSIDLPRERIATIEAADDPLIPPPMRESVRERLRPSIAYRFETGGHFPYVVRPALYTSLLEEQLGLSVTGESWGDGEVRAR